MKSIHSIITVMLVAASLAVFGQGNAKVFRPNAPVGNVNFNRNPTVQSRKEMKRQVGDFSQPKYADIIKNSRRQQKAREKSGKGI